MIAQVKGSQFRALTLIFIAALGFVVALASSARGQEATPAQKSEPQPQSTPEQKSASEPPKKINERPAAAQTPEPFDDASVEKMAGQCVRLETEAGVIEVEMLAESAPETVRNFLELTATGAFDTTTFSPSRGFVIQGGDLSTRQTLTPELAEDRGGRLPTSRATSSTCEALSRWRSRQTQQRDDTLLHTRGRRASSRWKVLRLRSRRGRHGCGGRHQSSARRRREA